MWVWLHVMHMRSSKKVQNYDSLMTFSGLSLVWALTGWVTYRMPRPPQLISLLTVIKPWQLCGLVHAISNSYYFFGDWKKKHKFDHYTPSACARGNNQFVSQSPVGVSTLLLANVSSESKGFWNISNWRRLFCQYVTIVRVALCTCNFESDFHNAL